MIRLKSAQDIAILREGGAILAQTLQTVRAALVPGVRAAYLDSIAEEAILQAGAKPAFKGYEGFPATLCVSVNDEVVHGIPGDKVLQEGDIVGIDCGVTYKGLITDAAMTVPVGKVRKDAQRLIRVAEEALHRAIDFAAPGKTTGDLGALVQRYVEKQGFGVVRALVGHGVGYAVHEEPKVPNYGVTGSGALLEPGLVIAIEPMITAGGYEVKTHKDGWTIVTVDGSLASHAEHTVVITETGCEILTQL